MALYNAFLSLIFALLVVQVYSSRSSVTREDLNRTEECVASLNECLAKLDVTGTLVSECDVLPTAPESRADPVDPQGFNLTELRTGVFAYYDGFYTSLMMVEASTLLVMDFPDSLGSNLPNGTGTRLTEAAEIVLNGVVPTQLHMVYSHSHFDHIGAATRFYNYFRTTYPTAGIDIWATEVARNMMELSPSGRAPPPNQIVRTGTRTIILGPTLQYEMTGLLGHSDSDMVGYVPAAEGIPGVIYYVDILFPRYAPFQNLGSSDEVRDYISVQNALLAFDFDYFISGHLFVATRFDLEANVAYTDDLLVAARQGIVGDRSEEIALQLGKFNDPNAAEFGNLAFMSDFVFRGPVRNICIRIMMEQWGCRLGGVDLTIFDNCTSAFLFFMIDA